MMTPNVGAQETMLETFERHMTAEATGDLAAAMDTTADDPYVNHVPVLTGGVGRKGVRRFYRDHLVGKFLPPDAEITAVSRTVDAQRIVDEGVVAFTHTTAIDWMLPGIAPTGKKVEVAAVAIVEFDNGKVASERIYWDQASVLVQVGLLSPAGLPVSGAESARKVLDPTLPPREI